MSFTIVFDVLQESIKEMPMFFRNRGSERFDRGELGREVWGIGGFGRGHKDSRSVKQKKWGGHFFCFFFSKFLIHGRVK